MSHLIQNVLPLLFLFLSPLRFSSSSSLFFFFSFLRHFSSFLKFIVYLEFPFFTLAFFLSCSFAFVFPLFWKQSCVFRARGDGSLFLSLTSCFAHGNVEKREIKENSTNSTDQHHSRFAKVQEINPVHVALFRRKHVFNQFHSTPIQFGATNVTRHLRMFREHDERLRVCV